MGGPEGGVMVGYGYGQGMMPAGMMAAPMPGEH
jgi:hypothetical protein